MGVGGSGAGGQRVHLLGAELECLFAGLPEVLGLTDVGLASNRSGGGGGDVDGGGGGGVLGGPAAPWAQRMVCCILIVTMPAIRGVA